MPVQELEYLIARYREHGDLLVLLKDAQRDCGGLTKPILAEIAARLPLPVGDLNGIASFYSFLSPRARGRHTISVCHSVPCRMGAADGLLAVLEDELKIKPGETTADGRFSLELTNCVGACDHRSALIIDGRRLGGLDRATLRMTLAEFK